jgi:hypothetical protein
VVATAPLFPGALRTNRAGTCTAAPSGYSKFNDFNPEGEIDMSDDPRQMTDTRESTPGQDPSKLAPTDAEHQQEQPRGEKEGSDDSSRDAEAGTASQAASETHKEEPKAEEGRSRFAGRARIAAASGVAVGLAGALAARARARRRRTLLAKVPFSKVRRAFGSR